MPVPPDSEAVFPGWYAASDGRAVERFWNGSSWTGAERPAEPAPPTSPALEVTPPEVTASEVTPPDVTPPDVTEPPVTEPASVRPPRPEPPAAEPTRTSLPESPASLRAALGDAELVDETPSEPAKPKNLAAPSAPTAKAATAKAARGSSSVKRQEPASRTSPSTAASSPPAVVNRAPATTERVSPMAGRPPTTVPTDSNGSAKPDASAEPAAPAAAPVFTPPARPAQPDNAARTASSAKPASSAPSPGTAKDDRPATPVEPDSDRSPDQDGTARNWIAIGLVGAACALAGTFLLGVVVGGSGSDESGAPATSTTGAPVEASTSTTALAMADDGVSQEDLDLVTARVDELETREAELDAQVVTLEEELEAVTAEAANLTEHNLLLQSWFTTEVLARSQNAWDGEVARACSLADTPTVDDLVYIRALEVIGTPADLLDEVLDCRQADS